jgi:hypothetical protein
MPFSTANYPGCYNENGKPPLVLRSLALHAFAGYGEGVPAWIQKANILPH